MASSHFLRPGGGSDRLWLLRAARHTSTPALPTLSYVSDDRYVYKTLPRAVLFSWVRELRLQRPSNMLVYLRDGSASTCCHAEIEVAAPTFYLTLLGYTDTGPVSPSADPITPGAWQGSHWSINFEVTGMTQGSHLREKTAFFTQKKEQATQI